MIKSTGSHRARPSRFAAEAEANGEDGAWHLDRRASSGSRGSRGQRSALDLAKREAERSAHLGSESAVSPADVERAETEAKAAAANARRSAARLAELGEGCAHRRPQRRPRTTHRGTGAPENGDVESRATPGSGPCRVDAAPQFDSMSASSLKSEARRSSFWEIFLVQTSGPPRRSRSDVFRAKQGLTCGIYGDDGAKITQATVFRLAWRMGRRGLPVDSPTARLDVRVREVFVELPGTEQLVPDAVFGARSRRARHASSEAAHGMPTWASPQNPAR